MNSSGIKRGLAATAISALAVTGLPFLASTASAEPIADQFGDDNAIAFYTQELAGNPFSAKNDGTNTTVSLVVGGGANVTSVQYQYETLSAVGTWNNIGDPVARNADGVFATEWTAPPADVTQIRAVPNTGLANAQVKTPAANLGTGAGVDTVELASEGSLGIFQEPYTNNGGYDGTTSELVGVTGTVSQGSAAPTVTDASHGTGASDVATLETTTDTASDTFNAVVDLDGYPYSGGAEANQVALNAANADTDDAEASTLYVQTIGSITATPATQEDVTPADSEVDLTVLDTTGKPVAGAEVFRGSADTDTDGAGPDTDTDGTDAFVGYTDGRGQIKDVVVGGAGTVGYYANTTDNDAFQAGTDPTTNATVTTYTPTLAEVDIVNERTRSNFDLDELLESPSDDFTIETKDQRGNLYEEAVAGSEPEYRYVIDPSAAGLPTYTTAWVTAVDTATAGEHTIDGLQDGDYDQDGDGADDPLPEGSFTIEARRPNVGGTGLMNATPENFTASESEITFDEGSEANAPVNGTTTIEGVLANDGGGLGGREVQLTYTDDAGAPVGDAGFAPQSEQPAGVTVTPASGGVGSTAAAVTAADGSFAVKLKDPTIPANVTPTAESGTLNGIAEESATDTTTLQGPNGVNDSTVANDPDNAEQEIGVNWAEQADVDSITIDTDVLDGESFYGGAAPGSPVDLDITVEDAAGNDLVDYPVEVTVNKGFVSPNAENENDLALADGHDAEGDLWGFFQNDGTSEDVSTGDAAEAGAVVAMERDEDFDDNGLSTMTVTVVAGGVTETEEITFDARNFLTLMDHSLERAATSPQGNPVSTEEDVDFQLWTSDQFGNLVGDHQARISDDSTVADFETDEDFDFTLTDFTTSGTGITAFSDATTTQTLTATMNSQEVVVDNAGNPDVDNRTDVVDSDPIEWLAVPVEPKVDAGLVLRGENNGAADDNLKADAKKKAAGATVKLFRKRADGSWKFLREATLNAKGNFRFKNVNDLNGNKKTRYKAVVQATEDTRRDVDKKTVR